MGRIMSRALCGALAALGEWRREPSAVDDDTGRNLIKTSVCESNWWPAAVGLDDANRAAQAAAGGG